MRARFKRIALAVLAGPLLYLPGCASEPPAPAVPTVVAEGPFIHLLPPHPRPKRPDPCKLAKVDLSPERKEELFKQFASKTGTDLPLDQAASLASSPSAATASSPECRQAAR